MTQADPYGAAYVRVLADLEKFEGDLKRKMQKSLDEVGKNAKFQEFERTASKAGERAGEEVEKGMEDGLKKKESDLKREAEKQGNKAGGGFLTGLRRALFSRGGLYTLLGTMVAGIGGYLQQALPAILATIPAFAVAGAGALGTLALAVHGFTAAVGAGVAGNTKLFNEQLAKLAPSAQAVAKEIVGLTGVFKQLQQSVQEQFFAPLRGSFQNLARSLIPILRAQLPALAGTFGELGASFLGGISSKAGSGAIGTILGELNKGLQPFVPLLGKMVELFLRVGAVAAPFLTALFGQGASALEKFLINLQNSLGNGGVLKFFAAAGDFFSSLGGALGPILGLLTDILSAFAGFGSPTLALLGTLATTLRTVLAPLLPGLSTFLSGLVTGVGRILVALTPGLTAIAGALGQFFTALGDQLPGLVTALLPFLQALSKFLVAAGPSLAALLVQLVTSLFPALVQILQDMLPLWQQMTPFWVQFAKDVLPQLVPLLGALVQLFFSWLPLMGPLVQLFVAFVPLLEAILPIMPPLIQFWTDMVKWFGNSAIVLFTIIGYLIQAVTWLDKIAINNVWGPAFRALGHNIGVAGDAAHDLFNWLQKIAGVNLTKHLDTGNSGIQMAPQYAAGGKVTQPTLAWVGEGGVPEAIVPMGSPAQARQVARQTGLLTMIGSGGGGGGWAGDVHVYLGTREITDIVSVQVDKRLDQASSNINDGTRGW